LCLECIHSCPKTVLQTSSRAGACLFILRMQSRPECSHFSLSGPTPVPGLQAELSPEELQTVKTNVKGLVCAVSAAILGCSAAFLSGCAGLVSGTNSTGGSPLTLVITSVQTGSITTTSSQVVWTTNVPANSSVDYGTTSAYGNTTSVDTTMVTSHQMTLSGLAAGTTYYYQVNSTDSKVTTGTAATLSRHLVTFFPGRSILQREEADRR